MESPTMTIQNQETSVSYFAYDIAEAFYNDCCQDNPDELDWVHDVARLVGQHLASAGHAGDWSQIDMLRFMEQIKFMPEHEQTDVHITLIGLYTWLGVMEVVPMHVSTGALQAVQTASGDPEALLSLVLSGLELLAVSEALEEEEIWGVEEERQVMWN